MNMTDDLRTTLEAAVGEARERRHEYVTLEHLLLAICADPKGLEILQAVAARPKRLVEEIEQYFEEVLVPVGPPSDDQDDDFEPKQTIALWRVVERAAMHVQGAGKDTLDTGQVLASLMREQDCHATYLLQSQGVQRLDIVRYLSHGTTKIGGGPATGGESSPEVGEDDGEFSGDPLEAFATDLNERAAQGRIDPLIGREDETRLVIETLARRRKNNPVLVGDPGVGKTAIVEGLALAIVEQKVPKLLADATIYSLDMGGMLAGTKYRGEFEQRLKAVIQAVTDDPNHILFIDEIHTIVGAGAVSSGSLDASNILKPALASGELRCIGSTTHAEYKSAFDRDRALARRFQQIEITEPSVEDSIEILRGLRERYEEHHDVRYADEGLERAAELAAKYINDRRLPDKAIDVIDQAGASNQLLETPGRLDELGSEEMAATVARVAKIPSETVSDSDEQKLAKLEPELKRVIFGQDSAIEAISSAIKLSRAGLGAAERPIGSFLFSGPTGVGKTELARQLAEVLGVEFLRFDMSEYMEKHTVSRLIGAPPGYVGFDQGGLLTDAIRRTPHAVLLLDEIEKAHPDVFNILLQVMDHATLTDNNGRKADFRHVVLLMTTNAGGRELTSKGLGFASGNTDGDARSTAAKSRPEIERMFSPEFRNRLDNWIVFEPLQMPSIERIVDKLFGELVDQLAERDIEISLSGPARSWLAEHGYEPDFGARPMRRLLDTEIRRPLADDLLFGMLKDGGSVVVRTTEEVQSGAAAADATLEVTPNGLQLEKTAREPAAEDGEAASASSPEDAEVN